MEQWAGSIVFAHGGGKMDPRFATILGVGIMGLGSFLVLKSCWQLLAKRRFDLGLIYVGTAILAFGYVFLASAQNWPGGAVAFQVFAWLVILPVLFVPVFLWKWKQIEDRMAAERDGTAESLGGIDASFVDAESAIIPLLQPGEKVLWVDRPWLQHFLGEFWAAFLFGLILSGLGAVVLSLLGWSLVREGIKPGSIPGYLAGLAAGSFFFGLGVFLLQCPWRGPVRLRRVIYALTDRRAIVLTGRERFWNPVPGRDWGQTIMEFDGGQILARQRWRVGLNRFDWVLLQETVGRGKKRTTNRYGLLGLEHPEVIGEIMDRHYPVKGAAAPSSALAQP